MNIKGSAWKFIDEFFFVFLCYPIPGMDVLVAFILEIRERKC